MADLSISEPAVRAHIQTTEARNLEHEINDLWRIVAIRDEQIKALKKKNQHLIDLIQQIKEGTVA